MRVLLHIPNLCCTAPLRRGCDFSRLETLYFNVVHYDYDYLSVEHALMLLRFLRDLLLVQPWLKQNRSGHITKLR